ncbi:hypothetical protein FB558_5639 [Pseudonocardia kunmingensis]|uniref:Uncharacterized protein n=1 Tax=Pseudonocardia kunmingensis TaxID=630975 RepID=A0A543DKT5_9PSEU|nr:hypothetical protein FB558_5639 [Pseudonocardia kunmingensis]
MTLHRDSGRGSPLPGKVLVQRESSRGECCCGRRDLPRLFRAEAPRQGELLDAARTAVIGAGHADHPHDVLLGGCGVGAPGCSSLGDVQVQFEPGGLPAMCAARRGCVGGDRGDAGSRHGRVWRTCRRRDSARSRSRASLRQRGEPGRAAPPTSARARRSVHHRPRPRPRHLRSERPSRQTHRPTRMRRCARYVRRARSRSARSPRGRIAPKGAGRRREPGRSEERTTGSAPRGSTAAASGLVFPVGVPRPPGPGRPRRPRRRAPSAFRHLSVVSEAGRDERHERDSTGDRLKAAELEISRTPVRCHWGGCRTRCGHDPCGCPWGSPGPPWAPSLRRS